MNLTYRPGHVIAENLALGECTIRRCSQKTASWWNLWFRVTREDDGQPIIIGVPIAVRGTHDENGPGGRTWGFADRGGGCWQVSPSIHVIVIKDETEHEAAVVMGHEAAVVMGHEAAVVMGHEAAVRSPAHRVSIWHQTPTVIGVPTGEAWQE